MVTANRAYVFGYIVGEEMQLSGRGRIARALGMAGRLERSISAVAILHLVRKYRAMIGIPDLAHNDLRRTFAQLGYDAGVLITQISILLGHSDVKTTERYLNLALDLDTTVSDFIPLSGN